LDSAIRQKLNDDLRQAMKARDELRCGVIRFLLSDINYAEIAKQAPIEDGDILGVIAKQVRQHRESIDAFKQGCREDLASKEESELAILQSYLPEQMGREDIAAAAREVIKEVCAEGMKDKGKVMSSLMPRLKGKAEGRIINEVVTELLS
jgi:uncharacterized protein YqeY